MKRKEIMVRTRRQQRDQGESGSAEQAPAKRPKLSAEEREAEELNDPRRALRGKYGAVIKDIFERLIDAVDESALPYFRAKMKRGHEALQDFVLVLSELFDDSSDAEEDTDAEEYAEYEEEEEEFEEEAETEDDLDDENFSDKLEDDDEEEEIEEEEADDGYDDDDGYDEEEEFEDAEEEEEK